MVLDKIPEWVDEILLVDGHSTDSTVQVATTVLPRIKVLYQPKKGKGDALRCGFKNASKDVIVTLDADGATDPQDIAKFIESLLEGFDFAKGSRYLVKLPAMKAPHRIFGNLLITGIFNVLYGVQFTDLCSGYNAFWRKAVERVDLSSNDCFEDEPLLIAKVKKAGLRIVEVGHLDLGRIGGESKSPSWRQGFKAFKTIVRVRIYG